MGRSSRAPGAAQVLPAADPLRPSIYKFQFEAIARVTGYSYDDVARLFNGHLKRLGIHLTLEQFEKAVVRQLERMDATKVDRRVVDGVVRTFKDIDYNARAEAGKEIIALMQAFGIAPPTIAAGTVDDGPAGAIQVTVQILNYNEEKVRACITSTPPPKT